MAAGIATLEVYEEQQIFQRANELAPYFEQGLHSLRGLPNVIDIRNYGLMGAVELSPIPGLPMKRIMDIYNRSFKKGLFIRTTGSTVACAPPLISDKKDIDFFINTLGESIVDSSKYM
jgi:beta-alanine--pyruvate transaminase